MRPQLKVSRYRLRLAIAGGGLRSEAECEASAGDVERLLRERISLEVR